MAINKVIFYGETLVDMTTVTVSPETLGAGVTALDKSGKLITGKAELTAPDTGTDVAAIGSRRFTSVQKALQEAQSGDTVTMIADSDESGSDLVINRGVTLDMKAFDLTAGSILGKDGGFLIGNTYSTGDFAKLKTDSLTLGDTPYVDSENWSLLPAWSPANSCYVFTWAIVRTDLTNTGLRINEETKQIHFQFGIAWSGTFRSHLLADNGASDNELEMRVQLRWQSSNGEYVVNHAYADRFVKTASSNTTTHYTFTLNGFDTLQVDLASLRVQAMVVADCGAIAYGTVFTAADAS